MTTTNMSLSMTESETAIYDAGESSEWTEMRKSLVRRAATESRMHGGRRVEILTADGIVVETVRYDGSRDEVTS